MKTLISKIVTAGILSITLVVLVSIFSHTSMKSLLHHAATVPQVQPGPEIPGHSYAEVLNTLFSSLGR